MPVSPLRSLSVLLDVRPGDTVVLHDRRGPTHQYRIVSRDRRPRESVAPGLFTTSGSHRLVLITCGGTDNEQSGQHTDNTVVIAWSIHDGWG